MFHWVIATSLKLRYLVVALAAVMVLYGADRMTSMPIDVFPEFSPPRVQIQTEGPGMSAVEVEELLSIPIEQALRGVPGVDSLRSRNVTGLSSILLVFKPGVDLLEARQLVQERLQTIAPHLPVSNVGPVMLPPLSSVARVLQIGMTSKVHNLDDLSMLAFWNVQFRLKSVPGVANVLIWGYRNKQLLVQADTEKLRAHGVTLDQLKEATGTALNVGLLKYTHSGKGRVDGFIETPTRRLMINHDVPIRSPQEMADIVVKATGDGRLVRIGDVAKVEFTHDPLIGDAAINGQTGLLLVVQKYPWANTLEVTRGLERALDEIRPGLAGVEFHPEIFRPASFVETSFDNLTHAMLLGALLVVAVLVIFLFEWRVALISLVAIPLSLVASGLVLFWQGATINVMILAGFFVGLGSIVDDAIIDIENILRRLRQNAALPAEARRSRARVILDASLEVRRPIVYATLIIVLSVTPIFHLHGLSGAFFTPLAYAYCLALLASMVVALTITPAMALILLRRTSLASRDPPVVGLLKRAYGAMLRRTLRVPIVTFGATTLVALAGILTWPMLGHSLMPSFRERNMLMHWVTRPSTSREGINRISIAACNEFLAIKGVLSCGSHMGRTIGGPEIVGMNFGENWLSIDPKADYDATMARINEVAGGYPGVHGPTMTFLRERIKEVLTGGSESIVVRIFGPDLKVLREKAAEVERAMASVSGLLHLQIGLQVDNPQVQIKVDVEKAGAYSLKPGDVRRAAGALLAGTEVTDLFRDGRINGVVIWSTQQTRHSLDSIRDMLLDTPSGRHVRLADVADVRIVPTPNVILRDELSRRIDVSADIADNQDLVAIAEDVKRRISAVAMPLGYRAEVLGEHVERQQSAERLRWVTLAVVIGILLLLQASFRSWTLAWLTFIALPAAVIGGVLANYLGDGIVSLGSLVGMLTILGIAARNGILLIHHYQFLEEEEGVPFGLELVIRGALERLSPILMTSLCTGLALLPLVIAGRLPGHEIEHPMAVVIIGGLITSTLLNLFVVPVLYLWFGGRREAGTRVRSAAPAVADA